MVDLCLPHVCTHNMHIHTQEYSLSPTSKLGLLDDRALPYSLNGAQNQGPSVLWKECTMKRTRITFLSTGWECDPHIQLFRAVPGVELQSRHSWTGWAVKPSLHLCFRGSTLAGPGADALLCLLQDTGSRCPGMSVFHVVRTALNHGCLPRLGRITFKERRESKRPQKENSRDGGGDQGVGRILFLLEERKCG